MLSFKTLRNANKLRLPLFKNAKGKPAHSMTDGSDWSLTDWVTAVAGEVGEAANIIKKIRRGDISLDECRFDLGREFADIVTYLDILAMQCKIDLEAAVREKFNDVSRRVFANVYITGDDTVISNNGRTTNYESGLEQKIIEARREIVRLEKENGEWIDIKDSLLHKIREKDKKIEDLQEILKDRNKMLNTIGELIKPYNNVHDCIKSKDDKIELYRRMTTELNNTIIRLKAGYDKLRETINNF